MKMMMMMMVAVAMHAGDGQVADGFTKHQNEMHAVATKIRKQHGLPAQVQDAKCAKCAQAWAEQMAAKDHMRHGGGEQIIAAGYRSASACFGGWMNSRGHRSWVLSTSTNRCGWGRCKSRSGRWYYAGAFRTVRRGK